MSDMAQKETKNTAYDIFIPSDNAPDFASRDLID